jgi:hypothetical protein
MFFNRKKNAGEINANGIRAKMCDVISKEFKRLIKEQIDPWLFFKTGKFSIKKFDGRDISYPGVGFEGTPRHVFWSGYIEPYIEDITKRMIEETIKLAKDKNVQISAVLDSTKANLSGGIDTVYRKMQEVDRRLRGNGYPESVPKQDVSCEIKKMNDFLDRQIRTYEDLAFQIPDSWFKKWYQENPHWVWIVGIIIGTGVLAYISPVIKKLIKMFIELFTN